jgi:hypothetical protein
VTHAARPCLAAVAAHSLRHDLGDAVDATFDEQLEAFGLSGLSVKLSLRRH